MFMKKGSNMWYSSLAILGLSLCCTFIITSHGTSSQEQEDSTEHVKMIEYYPIVETAAGKVQGLSSVSREGRDYKEFLGIPYARPPVGDLRYKAPQPPDSWEGVREASRFGSKCVQFDMFTDLIVGSEDCLFLNVFTPKIPRKRKIFNWTYSKSLFPVIVYVHGGHFLYGASDEYRPDYFMDEDVVVVTLNYRLNSFGFLNTGDSEVTGNMGLKDQNMALKWVKANIAFFGGDPNNVVLTGQSAGGVSVHYHLLSPMSQGLFHAAISYSGSALSSWASTRNVREQANRLGKSLHCPTNSSSDLVKCLRSLDAISIVNVHSEIHNLLNDRLAFFTPTVESPSEDDEAFMLERPEILINSGRIASKVPWMTGVTSEEGLIFLMGLFFEKESVENLNAQWDLYAPRLFGYEDLPKPDQMRISRKVRSHYLHSKAISEHYSVQNAEQLFSDANFNFGLRAAALAHSKHQPTYLYYYSHRGTFGFYQSFLAMSRSVPKLVDWAWSLGYRWFHYELAGKDEIHFGACHGDDTVLLWKIPLLSHLKPDSEDYYVSKSFIRSIVAFAKDRTALQYEGIQWKPLDVQDTEKPLKLMRIDSIPEVVDEPFFRSLSFWRQEIYHDIKSTRDYHSLNG